MIEHMFTDEDYRKGFEAYMRGVKKCDCIGIAFFENELAQLIRNHSDNNFKGIYTVRDRNYFGEALKTLSRNEDSRGIMGKDSRYRKGLRLLDAFFASKYVPVRKLKPNAHRKAKVVTAPSVSQVAIPAETQSASDSTLDVTALHTEGERREMELERAYRNPQARRECLCIWGAQCQVCGMRFKDCYGEELGQDFIEIHHLIPISTRDADYKINPATELVPLCSNCHSMIHRGKNGPLTLAQLRESYIGPKTPIEKLMEQ